MSRIQLSDSTNKSTVTLGTIVSFFFCIPMMLIGIDYCTEGINSLKEYNEIKDVYFEITGTITDIDVKYDAKGKNHIVYVDYSYEGQEYTNVQYDLYNDSMHVGDNIGVLISKYDLKLIKPDKYYGDIPQVIIIGVVLILLSTAGCISGIFKIIRSQSGSKYIKKVGRAITATVQSVTKAPNTTEYGGTLYRVACIYEDPKDNKVYRFLSEPVYEDIGVQLTSGMEVPVYVKRGPRWFGEKYKHYFVDLSAFSSIEIIDYT